MGIVNGLLRMLKLLMFYDMYTRSKLNVLVRIRLKEKSYKRRYNIHTHICSLQCSGQKKWKYFVQKLSLMIGRILRCIKIMDELLAARYIHWNVLFILDFVRIVEIKKLHKNTRLRLTYTKTFFIMLNTDMYTPY